MGEFQLGEFTLSESGKDKDEDDQQRPKAQGLYHPAFEHDACGIGFVVNVQGKRSHSIVRQALTILVNLTHRGARGSDPNTGDGAGILFQLPHRFFQQECYFRLPAPGQYGVGMLFLPPNPHQQEQIEQHLTKIITQEGQIVLGWRTVPTDGSSLGQAARKAQPVVRQVFVGRAKGEKAGDELAFERKLYVIRKRAEREIRYADVPGGSYFYISSLSSRTIVYKGMLLSEQVELFYPDLLDPAVESAVSLVHSRFSTNTFPSWDRAHPYRYILHNGEINTVRGNVNWIQAREALFESGLFGDDLAKLLPVVNPDGSDTAMFDNVLELLVLNGRSLPHAMMMMIPEPWEKREERGERSEEKAAFYEYHSCLMEPWDGPAAIAFTDGTQVGAVLDRNGLRPARYIVTKDDLVILSSETGVLDIPPQDVAYKGRLEPGKMLLIDTKIGRIIADEEIKAQVAGERPYRQWLHQHLLTLDTIATIEVLSSPKVGSHATLSQRQHTFGYTYEDQRLLLAPMMKNGSEATGSMGDDTPLAILSSKPQLLPNYFRQLFAQVTNPPIDAIREEIVTSTTTLLGPEQNLLAPDENCCKRIKLPHPILTNSELAKLRNIWHSGFKAVTLPILFPAHSGGVGLEKALQQVFETADSAIADGANLLILSDRDIDHKNVPIPALLACAGLHHHLIRQGNRTRVSLLIESGEPREVHHFATLIGYGADAINPYLAYETIAEMQNISSEFRVQSFELAGEQRETRNSKLETKKYIKAIVKGIVKIMSKMGISTIQSYRGAQIFEAVGLHSSLIEAYFTGTPSRIQGADIHLAAREAQERHNTAFPERPSNGHVLPAGGKYQWRQDGEHHLFNPATIHKLQHAVRAGDYKAFKEYSTAISHETAEIATLRGLFDLNIANSTPVPLDEVESVEQICRRFKSGAMSYGSISQEAHETLAIAMNRLGGKSNSGEGGEDPTRYTPDANGDSRSSAIKQVASGRFGVTSHYLVNASELQIKMAQGAKPGEGGQLPGHKVYPWIAKVRHSTPGVELISPPPHHDIYSIEDLAQLIHDLKSANPTARINVKLVSEVGVGTVAAGVAKGYADVILISGHDGGTGASPQTSIKHAGLPWELGLAETHQTLLLNNLRHRVRLETDGQLKTGRDVVIATLLGAEEFGFATAPLVAMGCIMMRVCHLDTCPVGIATQNPALRAKFAAKPEHVINFMRFIAQEMREIMAQLGFRTVDEMVGRTDKLRQREASSVGKNSLAVAKLQALDLSPLLYQPVRSNGFSRSQTAKAVTTNHLVNLCQPALEKKLPVFAQLSIRNTERAAATTLGSEVTKRYGAAGLPADTIHLYFQGSAGQSFGAFIPKGITLELEGDANDYVGKGLSGGKLIIYPPQEATFAAEENVIIGNTALYGGTGGEVYVRGRAGERFGVRNSGVTAVIEGVGDHGCEYMTGGTVVVLGKIGRNFAAGMSGGVAYVLDETGCFHHLCNQDMVDLETIETLDELDALQVLIRRHASYTNSPRAFYVLRHWDRLSGCLVKVMPREYKRVLETRKEMVNAIIHN